MRMCKLYRKIFKYSNDFFTKIRIFHLKMKFDDIIIRSTKIEKNCDIRVYDGGKLVIINSHLSFGVQVICDSNAELIIEDTYIGSNCVIVAAKKIHIKKHGLIAEMVTIRDQSHNFEKIDQAKSEQGSSSKEVIIEENVWIGAKATILKGVHVGKNSIIAAHSVVNTDCMENAIYGGVPSQLLKKISNNSNTFDNTLIDTKN